MDLQQSITLEALKQSVPKDDCPCHAPKVSARQIAGQVFATAQEQGTPFEGLTAKQWRKRWLASKDFVLMEIPVSIAAAVGVPMNKNKVLAAIRASADSILPIVVDINKNEVGRAPNSGYVPPIIVVDGKHRFMAVKMQGHGKIKAWVGIQALKQIQAAQAKRAVELDVAARRVVRKRLGIPMVGLPVLMSKADTTNRLYAGMGGTPVPRQDVGDGGSQPTMRAPAVKAHGKECDCAACKSKMEAMGGGTGGPGGATSGPTPPMRGTLESDASDTKSVVDSSDTDWPQDPSDRKVRPDKAQTSTATDQVNYEVAKTNGNKSYNPVLQSPGSGVGPRLGDARGLGSGRHKGGASRSELTKVMGKAQKVESGRIPGVIRTKKKMSAVAPPGREDQVKKLKPKFGKKAAFRIAWDSYNKGKD